VILDGGMVVKEVKTLTMRRMQIHLDERKRQTSNSAIALWLRSV
jgi:hypothetical protein